MCVSLLGMVHTIQSLIWLLLFCFVVLGTELQALSMLGKHADPESHSRPHVLTFTIGLFMWWDAFKVHHEVEAWVCTSFLFIDG